MACSTPTPTCSSSRRSTTPLRADPRPRRTRWTPPPGSPSRPTSPRLRPLRAAGRCAPPCCRRSPRPRSSNTTGCPLAAANPPLAGWLADTVGGDRAARSGRATWAAIPASRCSSSTTSSPTCWSSTISPRWCVSRGLTPSVAVTVPPAVQAVRDAATGAGTRPPTSLDLDFETAHAAATFDRDAVAELRKRLDDTRQLAFALQTRLEAAATDDSRRAALIDAARWVIAPPQPIDNGDVDLTDAVDQAARRGRRDSTPPTQLQTPTRRRSPRYSPTGRASRAVGAPARHGAVRTPAGTSR